MAAEIGLSGLAVFIWLLFALFSSCVKICKKINGGFLKIAALAAIACLIAFLVNGLTESSLFYPREAVIFWYLAGLVLGMKKLVS